MYKDYYATQVEPLRGDQVRLDKMVDQKNDFIDHSLNKEHERYADDFFVFIVIVSLLELSVLKSQEKL